MRETTRLILLLPARPSDIFATMVKKRRRPCAPVFALAAAMASATAVHAQSVAPAGPTAGADARCEAALRAWASGGASHPGLVTFGTRYVPRSGEPRPRGGTGVLGDGGSLALGPATYRAGGPWLAGAMEGSEEAGYRYPGPREAAEHILGGRVRIEVGRAEWLANADVLFDGEDVLVRALGAGWHTPVVDAYAGALTLRSGATCRDGLVLGGGGGPALGVEGVTGRGVHLPLLGEVKLGTQIGRLAEGGPGNRGVLFHALRVETRPHPNVTLGLHRAVIFGGSASQTPLTARTIGLMLIGLTDTRGKDSDFENQVAAVDARWRTRIGGRPALFTAEYGADDSGFAFVRVPGVRITGSLRWGPHPEGWTGFEVIHMAPPVDAYPSWYRHGALAWGWTDRGVLLGSPLGGEGTLVAATWGRSSPDVSAEVLAGFATRGPQNLLARPGGGRGGVASASLRSIRGIWELSAVAAVSAGAESTAWRIHASVLRSF